MKRIAIIGGGIAGLTAAYQLAQLARAGSAIEAVVFESCSRFGGVIETVREGGFTIECGPDAWVTAKPWARELAVELGLESELLASNDATRKTHIFLPAEQHPGGSLVAMPDGFHMMVPVDLDRLADSAMLTSSAIAAYRAEPGRAAHLLATIPAADESVADFTRRHFGEEVLARVAVPLLSGVFGGDVHRLSVRAVMPAFVAMEREHGSLIAALQKKPHSTPGSEPVFTTLSSGLGTLVDRLAAAIPTHWLRLNTAVTALQPPQQTTAQWTVTSRSKGHHQTQTFDAVLLATPLDATRKLLAHIDSLAASLLPVESSSAVLVAFAYDDASRLPLPQGFGFLVPPSPTGESAAPDHGLSSTSARPPLLLACTFVDQKFKHRVPPGGRLLRAFFGGAAAERIARCNNDEISAIAHLELTRILNAGAPRPGSAPTPILTLVRRWPNSLPQYAVGHLDRVAELEARLRTAHPGLAILGNTLHGVGIPDLIRDARAAARRLAEDNSS